MQAPINLKPGPALQNKRKERSSLISELCGPWEGQSIRTANGANGSVTVWAQCELYFDAQNGRIQGKGVSMWRDQQIPFLIRGCFDRQIHRVELIKTHQHAKYATNTHYTLSVDANNLKMEGTYASGTIVLRKNRNWSGVRPGPQLGPSQPIIPSLSVSTKPSPVPNAAPPMKPTEAFLRHLFPGEWEKLLQILTDHDVDWDAFRLMQDQHLKELGVMLGPRLKIVKHLKSLPPSGQLPDVYYSSTSASSSGSGSSISAPVQAPTPQQPQQSTNGSNGGSSASPSTSTRTQLGQEGSAPQQPLPKGKWLGSIPSNFHCPITHSIMEDPVVLCDGTTYERSAIAQWLKDHNTSPMTGKILRSKDLNPNHSLRGVIEEWKMNHKAPE